MDNLITLAERVEAASGPDREIDRAIMTALKQSPDYAADWGPRDNCLPAPFAYTDSLDAAVMLVPPEHEWSVDCSNNSRALVESVHRGPLSEGLAATPALALTAASLRARAANGGTNG